MGPAHHGSRVLAASINDTSRRPIRISRFPPIASLHATVSRLFRFTQTCSRIPRAMMASQSPVVLDTPSPASFRIPSVTPQSHRKASKAAVSSSPGLEDLPTFTKVPAKGFKSGSYAQQVPAGATSGFASAASLWKTQQRFESQFFANEGGAIGDASMSNCGKAEKSAGKLSKPSKTQKPAKESKHKSGKLRSPSIEQVDQGQSVSVATGDDSKTGQETIRKPSISLSEYDFRPDERPKSPLPKPAPLKPQKKARQRTTKDGEASKDAVPKKPRKRTARSNDTAKDEPAKKPKKRLAKSESIILNSDEPDPIDVDQPAANVLPLAQDAPDVSVLEKTRTKSIDSNDLSAFEYTLQKGVHSVCEDSPIETADKSAYFSAAPQPEDRSEAAIERTSNCKSVAPSPAPSRTTASPAPIVAFCRRLSWTPLKNSKCAATIPSERPGTASSTGSAAPAKSLASLVSGFGYSEGAVNMQSHERTSTGEALTKRQRIELADASTLAPSKRKSAKDVPPEAPKKTAKVKKKPQTITALATKAYQEEDETLPGQAMVSDFFSGAQQETAPPNHDSNSAEQPAKLKKPRKPRAKKTDDQAPGQVAKKAARPKKSKVKFNEADYMAKLYTPDQARAQERNQDFVFGTSSQLAVDESPTFIREMQVAIRESEIMPPSQCGGFLEDKSSIQVPSAPHGTNLSVGQADRHHWSSAARDGYGDYLMVDAWELARRRRETAATTSNPTDRTHINEQSKPDGVSGDKESVREQDPPELCSEQDIIDQQRTAANVNSPIDLCQTSPTVANHNVEERAPMDTPHAVDKEVIDSAMVEEPNVPSPVQQPADDVWELLSSDSVQGPADDDLGPAVITPRSPPLSPISRPPQLMRSATSPGIHRTALQSLDANVGLLSHTSPIKSIDTLQHRALTTSAPTEQAKRPRGRPRKDVARTTTTASSPKRRGRPPKVASGTAALAASPQSRKWKAPRSGISASQPTESTEWMNIDEISDSDSPATPSPSRQRAGSSPPALMPLDVAVAGSPSLSAKAPAAVASTLKPNDPSFAAIQDQLFPEITATVKSTPPSTDLKNPTWHEKILLYDPIVLEDLTAWLNEQGLRIETQRLKVKPKTRGRKKKDAPPEEPEYETVKEELKPWMVQKWCEEKSICCLWKEGLRGGVRTRY